MIVKDEMSVISRCLESVRPLIDHWIIVDTGSIDTTQTIVRVALDGVPGELVERPWVDFAHNRSEALALARPHGTYALVIDADDELVLPAGFSMPKLDAHSYTVDIQDAGITYQRAQLFASSLPWRYAGVLHEFPTCEEATTNDHLSIVMRRNHDGARRRDPSTYRKDAALLERALSTETDAFLISRYTFYLAQSYRDCGELGQALSLYERRADLGFWDEERYVALLNAGRLRESLGLEPEETLAVYARASRLSPSRAEAAHGASRLCRFKARYVEGYELARSAVRLSLPRGGLFIEPWIYRYGMLDEFAVNASWCGHNLDCRDACRRALAATDLPATDRTRIGANLRFAEERIAEAPSWPVSAWRPERPQGGTELMVDGLRSRLGAELDRVRLGVNAIACEDTSGPLIVWIHHDVDQAAVQWLDDRAQQERVARFVFVSAWQMERFIVRFDMCRSRCVVIRNATAAPVLERAAQPRARLKLAYASTPFRGLAVLLEAWARLLPSAAELHIWSSQTLYGPGFDDAPYDAMFARARYLSGVHLHGIVPHADLCEALRDCDILAYPNTFQETSCLVAIEAMAAGCRIICPSHGALPETVDRFARLYPFTPDPDDHAERFAALLVEEIGNLWQGEPDTMLEQQIFVRARHDWAGRVAEWRELIDEVVVSQSSASSWRAATSASHDTDKTFDVLRRLKNAGFAPTGIIDAGAYRGDFSRNARGIFPDAHIRMIDALWEQEVPLARVAAEIGNASVTISLVGAQDDDAASFFVVDTAVRPDLVKTGSSTFRENSAFPMEERRIRQRTLAGILAGRSRRYELLKLDLQGAELAAIRGLGERLEHVEALIIEMSTAPYNKGGPLMHEVLSDLAGRGFLLYDVIEEHRYRDGSLLQIDGLFLRADSELRPTPPFWT